SLRMCISVGGVRGTGFFSNIVFVVVAMMEGWSGTGGKEEKRRNALFGPSATGAVEPESEALVLQDTQCFNDGWGIPTRYRFQSLRTDGQSRCGMSTSPPPPIPWDFFVGVIPWVYQLQSAARANRVSSSVGGSSGIRTLLFGRGKFRNVKRGGRTFSLVLTYPTSKCKFFFLIYASLADKNISPAANIFRESNIFRFILGVLDRRSIRKKKKEKKNKTIWIGQVSRELLGKEAEEDKFAGVSLGCSTGVETLQGEQNGPSNYRSLTQVVLAVLYTLSLILQIYFERNVTDTSDP
ncbi:LOW QUALITY PROTEIN: hypothetical protein V1478_001157, partial [Vespula squamosa]